MARAVRWESSLLEALATYGVKSEQITGVDLEASPEPADQLAEVGRGIEFLGWSAATKQRFDKIIANPPYVAIERVSKRDRRAACSISLGGVIKVTAAANLWYAFLCAAINLLRPSGSLCFLLPAAWEFANYATPLRMNIDKYFDVVEVHRCTQPLFRKHGIQEGAIVLIARGRNVVAPEKRVPIIRLEHESLSKLVKVLQSGDVSRIQYRDEMLTGPRIMLSRERQCLDEVMQISIGGVTGDARYFLLSEDERQQWGLPVESMQPVISRSKQLVSPVMDHNCWNELRRTGERIWLFRPSSTVMVHKAVRAYLSWGKREGCEIENQKIKARAPWHRTILPSTPDGFMSGMSNMGPWVCFRGMARLNATNTLYVVYFKNRSIPDDRAALALALLSSDVEDQLGALYRTYADGLTKLEPGDLEKVLLPTCSSNRGSVSAYRLAIDSLLQGDVAKARLIADRWFSKSKVAVR
jgi:adenine-specific DNA-methyltransferase